VHFAFVVAVAAATHPRTLDGQDQICSNGCSRELTKLCNIRSKRSYIPTSSKSTSVLFALYTRHDSTTTALRYMHSFKYLSKATKRAHSTRRKRSCIY
jgi:hypothetical protein